MLMFYLTIVNKTYVTVTLGWHDSTSKKTKQKTKKNTQKKQNTNKHTVSHFSYAPLFQGPYFMTKMLEMNILYDNLLIVILSV